MEQIWMRLVMAGIGAVSLYFGYKLFCDVSQATRRISSFAAGALLAVFGLGLLFVEARGIAAATKLAHHESNRSQPAEQGSWAAPRLHRVRVIERTI